MRFPFELTLKIAGHILKHRLQGTEKFAIVLQLEPLHLCNLSCTGCGRIREYADTLDHMLPLDRCLEAARECDAPMVSICGGEPLIYPHIEQLTAGLLKQGRIVYLCTNGLLLRRKLVDYLAAIYEPHLKPELEQLVKHNLLSDEDLSRILASNKPAEYVFKPSKWFYWNVHVDGLEETHDSIVERKGVFREAVRAAYLAKVLGFQVTTNTTVYRETSMAEIEQLLEVFAALGADGHTISPGYDFESAKQELIAKRGESGGAFFLTREAIRKKFQQIEQWGRRFNILGTPAYQEFLSGRRELHCTAWAIPTYNPRGWRSPCYLLGDMHFRTYRELLDKTEWERYGVVNGIARDPRCANCMTHCGYDPSGALSRSLRDIIKNLLYNFGPRPRPKVSENTIRLLQQYGLPPKRVVIGSVRRPC